MFDTNVLLDMLLRREPFYRAAKTIITDCAKGNHRGVILASNITDIFYIAQREGAKLHPLYLAMEELFELLLICEVKPADIMRAMDRKELDFEDCLLAVCAKRTGCDAIVTRNAQDFENAGIKVISPEEAGQCAINAETIKQ